MNKKHCIHHCTDYVGNECPFCLEEDFKAALKGTKLTDREIAEGYKVSVPTVRKWIKGTGRPHVAMIKPIIDFLKGK